MSIASVGTDTGGSIRIPAACCGIVGLKPAREEISASGVVPLSRQLDHVGPLARSVADASLLYDVLRNVAPSAPPEPRAVAGLKLAVLGGYFMERIGDDVEARVNEAIDALESAGAQISDAAIPHAKDMPPIYLHLVLADAAAYHATMLEQRPDAYTPNVRIRLEMGRNVLAEDYLRAMRGREVIRREVEQALAGVDALLLPSLSIEAPPIGASTVPVKGGAEPVRNAMLRLTQPFNLSGHPALSLPCGLTRSRLPVGLQVVGHMRRTPDLLGVGAAIERALASR
jgi:aspartyl-tRNA(Asn)/glutamyl-tRNA(Gln) amidotransferase subunit A